MKIRPIPTRYRGCYFRSRLEARWAVFFDAAKIKWEYEPQGFDVDGRPYLPDFYLPDFHCYFEVKGTAEYDLEFLRTFALAIGRPLVVAEGQIPDPSDLNSGKEFGVRMLHPFDPDDPDGPDDMAWGYNDMFLRCDSCGRIEIMNECYSSMKDNCGICGDKSARWEPLADALGAARSARFEHGERPR